jgi:AraC-like DNA-binding protein
MRPLALLPSLTPELLLGSASSSPITRPVRVSLGDAPMRDRAWLLQACFARLGFTYQVDPLRDVPIEADVVLSSVPGLGVATGRLQGSRNRRTRALVEGSAEDIGLIVNLRGQHLIAQGENEILLGDGEATFMSCSDPASLTHRPPGQFMALRFPRTQLTPLVKGTQDGMLRRIPSSNPALNLLRNYLAVALGELAVAGPDLQHLMVSHIHDLTAVVMGATRDAAHVAQGRGVRAARLNAIKQDIAKNLDRRDLSVMSLADRHRCTPRLVQRLFETEGTTFTEYVLAQRLLQARRLLVDPRRDGDKISAIAYDCGFSDLSYFNRVFRRQYGTAPSDVRAQARRDAHDGTEM